MEDEILAAFQTCLNSNYFRFNNITYFFSEDSVIMGNPLTPLLADIYTKNIDVKIQIFCKIS